jgi:putative effector of murein hydrolase LrgA (UPF0299 family)
MDLLFVLAAWVCKPLAFLFLPAFVMYMNRFQILPRSGH